MNTIDREICCCGSAASAHCAKCSRGYCCRKCQLDDWKYHKSQCGVNVTYREWVEVHLIKKIAGNISAMRAKYGDTITVNFPYSVQEYIDTDIKIAYLIAGDGIVDDHATPGRVFVQFTDRDFIVAAPPAEIIYNSSTDNPPSIWTVVL